MLHIQNLNKLNHKTLGKKNFYVARIEEQFSIDNLTYGPSHHQYKFELSNGKWSHMVTLNREPAQYNALGIYFTLHSSTGHKLYISKEEISNMDIFIDKLRLVALG
jgi:hypothetical protein